MYAFSFPEQLAKYVTEKWNHFVAGDSYSLPLLPSEQQLVSLLETVYFSSMETDEGRPLKFTVCCTPEMDDIRMHNQQDSVESWTFASNRPFSIQEVRRLAAATDLNTSTIWIRFPKEPGAPIYIHGLMNLGSSWANARNAFSYYYENLPNSVFVKCLSPGNLRVYQGQFQIASLQAGIIQHQEFTSTMSLLGAHQLFEEGQDLLRSEVVAPKHEPPREWHGFEWIAYVNTILSIVNSIQILGHGGAFIFASKDSSLIQDNYLKVKYTMSSASTHLRKHFVRFMNYRHQINDMIWMRETSAKNAPNENEINQIDSLMEISLRKLAEASKFIGGLSGTDGAIVMHTDLHLEGFGAEILLDKAKPSDVYEVNDPMKKDRRKLDSEQFGMRHRSAMRLCASVSDLVVFVVSQDGGISLIWNDDGEVCFKSGVNTTNANMLFP